MIVQDPCLRTARADHRLDGQEARVQTLRMVIEDRVVNARGEQVTTYEIQLRHPGQARVTTRRSADELTRDYDVWLSDGQTATSYQAATKVASVRALPDRVAGSDQDDLPPYARQYVPLTRLPAGELRKDPAMLLDAVKAQGFFPGPRVAFVEDANDTVAPIVRVPATAELTVI